MTKLPPSKKKPITYARKKKPPIIIPSIFSIQDQSLIGFMQECRERTVDMKDEKKCEHCKFRFRCYTEIKVEKKPKRKALLAANWWEVNDEPFNIRTKPYSKKKIQGGHGTTIGLG